MKTANPDRLSSLPLETLYELFSHVSLDGGGFSLVRASKTLYRSLILELYKEWGRKANWVPLFVGAVSGNLPTLKRCLEAGAPLDCQWPRYVDNWSVLNIDEGSQPLHVAMMHYQVEAVEWMFGQKIDPYEKDENGKMRTLDLICESRLRKGHYPEELKVAAEWRQTPLHIPNEDVLALRGRKIFDSVLAAGALHNPSLTRVLQWTPHQVEAKPVEFKEDIYGDFFSLLPRKVLLKVLSHLSPVDGGCSLVATSRFLYHSLILDLYREAGRQLSWLPLFVGAMDGNLLTLQLCLKAGAPIDHQWEANRLTSGWQFSCRSRPLHVAVDHIQVGSVRWLLAERANPRAIPGDERLPPYFLSVSNAVVMPHYLDRDYRQVLWWRQKDFTVPDMETLRKEYKEIEKLLSDKFSEAPGPALAT